MTRRVLDDVSRTLASRLAGPLAKTGAALEARPENEGMRVGVRFERGGRFELRVEPRPSVGRGAPLFETERFVVRGSVPAEKSLTAADAALVKRLVRLVRDLIVRSEAAAAPMTRDILARFEAEGGVESSDAVAHESILRVTFACNQGCGFCFVDLNGLMVPLDEIRRRLDAAGQVSRDEDLVISGGEPTAHPKLPEIVALARERGFRRITIQTNAVHLSKRSLVERLGENAYFVSFHSHVPRVYDRLTRSSRQFPLAVQGIRNLLRARSNQVVLNVIVNRLNYESMPEYAEFVDEMREGAPLRIFFSILNDVGLQRTPELAVDLAAVAPFLDRAVSSCVRRGIGVENLAGNCAPPACLVKDPSAHVGRTEYSQDDVHYRERFPAGELIQGRAKSPACRRCSYDKRCRGVAVRYAQMFGLEALKPVAAR